MPSIKTANREHTLYPIEKELYVSLTNLLEKEVQATCIQTWLNASGTIQFLSLWESVHNPNFKKDACENVLKDKILEGLLLTPKQWIQRTHAIGIFEKTATPSNLYVHPDIALAFCTWLNPLWKLLLFKDFQQLKALNNPDTTPWRLTDYIHKLRYTSPEGDSQPKVVPIEKLPLDATSLADLQEEDAPYYAMLGFTPAVWARKHPKWVAQGWHVRDAMSPEQSIVLDHLTQCNRAMIHKGMTTLKERLTWLHKTALLQLKALKNSTLWDNPAAKASPFSDGKENDFNQYLAGLLQMPPIHK